MSSLSLILEVTHARALERVGRVLSFSWVPCCESSTGGQRQWSLIPGSFWSASLDKTVHSNLEIQRALTQKREVELRGGKQNHSEVERDLKVKIIPGAGAIAPWLRTSSALPSTHMLQF